MKEKTFTLSSEQKRGLLLLMVWLPKTTSPKIDITASIDIIKSILVSHKYNPSQQIVLNELRIQYYSEVKQEEIIIW